METLVVLLVTARMPMMFAIRAVVLINSIIAPMGLTLVGTRAVNTTAMVGAGSVQSTLRHAITIKLLVPPAAIVQIQETFAKEVPVSIVLRVVA